PVVVTLFDNVNLVRCVRAVLGFPQAPCHRIPCETLWVSMPVAPDRRHGSRRVDERIVGWHRAVVVDAMDLPKRRFEVLGVRLVSTFAEREKQVILPVENQTAAVVHA